MVILAFAFNTVYCRNYSEDIYDYRPDGLYFTNSQTGTQTHYPRYVVNRKGIDVSKWQGDINWDEVSRSGIEFAMIKEGYGKKAINQVDRRFHKNLKEAQSRGIKCGAYHFSYALSEEDAIAEAKFCLENIRGYRLEYPIAFDIEVDGNVYLGKGILTKICIAFCREMRRNGYCVVIYTNLNWVKNNLCANQLFYTYDLWLARYNIILGPGYCCGMWQYTQYGSVGGIKGNVDRNECYLDYPRIMRDQNLNGF